MANLEDQYKPKNQGKILIIEPFYGGSHKLFIDIITKYIDFTLITMTAKKWPWRARCGALVVSEMIPLNAADEHLALLCSSVLNLSELLGLRPDLNRLRKIVYFHENQFVYPIQHIKERDVQFAYNEITTCLSADKILFNSNFNKTSLLSNINKIIKLLPDYRPKNLSEKISPKCATLYFPMDFSSQPNFTTKSDILHIVWPHRWEYDKDPQTFFNILIKLKESGHNFKVHILGKSSQDYPKVFDTAKETLKDCILTFGFVDSRDEFYNILQQSHVAVSTAKHEFFGVSMLESTYCGCFPIVPNCLVYPEIYPSNTRYNNEEECLKMLQTYCLNSEKALQDRKDLGMEFDKFNLNNVMPQLMKVLFE